MMKCKKIAAPGNASIEDAVNDFFRQEQISRHDVVHIRPITMSTSVGMADLWELLDLLANLNIEVVTVYSDDNFAYHDAIPRDVLRTGKRNTQRIERKHLTFRTRLKRLARKTICYSKTLEMHTILFGLLINVLEFNRQLL